MLNAFTLCLPKKANIVFKSLQAFPLETFKRPDVNTAEVKFSTVLAKNVTSVLGFKVLNGQTSEFSYGYHRSE